MANISKELKNIFHRYLKRLDDERTHRVSSYGSRVSHNRDSEDDYDGVIYFYEWSNINRIPKSFYSIRSFRDFLTSSGIYLEGYKWELLRNLDTAYVCCKKNEKDVIIKCTWDSLKFALENGDKSNNPYHSTGAPFFNPNYNRNEVDRACHIPIVGIQKPKMLEECESIDTWYG